MNQIAFRDSQIILHKSNKVLKKTLRSVKGNMVISRITYARYHCFDRYLKLT